MTTSREGTFDRYMSYNDTLMLPGLPGRRSCVLNKGSQDLNNAWFKKVDKQYRGKHQNQFDKVRPLVVRKEQLLYIQLMTLITNLTSWPIVVLEMGSIIHRLWLSLCDGADDDRDPMEEHQWRGSGAMSFKHNTFRLWGYYGYEKRLLRVCFKQKSINRIKQASHATLGPGASFKKISDGKFNCPWKLEAYFNEVVTSAKNGLQAIEVGGTTYSSYEDLKQAFATAVEKIRPTKNGSVKFNNTLALKEKSLRKYCNKQTVSKHLSLK